MVDSAILMNLLLMNTIGMSILTETLLKASEFCYPKPMHLNGKYKERKECFYFIQSTGLEMLLLNYRLDYNADDLRNGFNYYFRHQS